MVALAFVIQERSTGQSSGEMPKSLAMQKSRGSSWTSMAEPFRDVTGSNLVSQDVAPAQIWMKASGVGPLSLLFLPQEGEGG